MSILRLERDNTGNSVDTLQQKITYIKRADETSLQLIYGANVSIFNTCNEMMLAKLAYGKTDGKGFNHIVFNPENGSDISDMVMYSMGIEMAEYIGNFHGNYQVLVAVHQGNRNGENKHLHFIANNVDYMKGKRLSIDKKRLHELKKGCSQIAARYGIEPIRQYRKDNGDVVKNKK